MSASGAAGASRREPTQERGPAIDPRWGDALGGRFELIRVLDGGGRAATVLARYVNLDRPTVLRIAPWADVPEDFQPPPAWTAPEPRSSGATFLEEEARTLARMVHPGICRILDFGHSKGFTWIAMEHVEIPDLGTLLASGGPLPLKRALEMTIAVAEIVIHAHEQGYLHGNLTTRKVFLSPDGSVRMYGFTGERFSVRFTRDILGLASLLTSAAGWPAVEHSPQDLPFPEHLRGVLQEKQIQWLGNILAKARMRHTGGDLYASVRELKEDLEVYLDFVPGEEGADLDAYGRAPTLRAEPVAPREATAPGARPPSSEDRPAINLLGRRSRRMGADDLDLAPTLLRLGYTIFPSTAALFGCYMLHEEVSVVRTFLVLALQVCCFLLVVNIWTEEEG